MHVKGNVAAAYGVHLLMFHDSIDRQDRIHAANELRQFVVSCRPALFRAYGLIWIKAPTYPKSTDPDSEARASGLAFKPLMRAGPRGARHLGQGR